MGKEVDAWCTRCKMDLGHTVVAMVGTQVVQVMCRTCNSYHRYRPPKTRAGGSPSSMSAPSTPKAESPKAADGGTKRAPASPSAPRAPRSVEAVGPARWERLVEEEGGMAALAAVARPYSVKETFESGEWLLHPRFGLGRVSQIRPPDKAEVFFREGEKTLIMNRT